MMNFLVFPLFGTLNDDLVAHWFGEHYKGRFWGIRGTRLHPPPPLFLVICNPIKMSVRIIGFCSRKGPMSAGIIP